MPDQDKVKGLIFKIPQKNKPEEVATSNKLGIVNVPFRFYRYQYIEPADPKDSSDNVEIKGYSFNLKNVSTIPIDQNGFLYIYYQEKKEKDEFDYSYGAEYQLNIYKTGNQESQNCLYTKIHPKSGNENDELKWKTQPPSPHINFLKGDIVWVAYSEVRWTAEFRERIMNDFESVKKRFSCLEIDIFVKESDTTRLMKDYFLPNHYANWGKDPKSSQQYNIIYGYEKVENLNIYTFNVASATLFVDDMCNLVAKKNNYFREYINKISTGIDPITGQSCPDKEAYQALFMSASTLYPILLDMTDKSKSAGEDKSPIKYVQDDKFFILLDFENRSRKIDAIHSLQDRTLLTMNSYWFKYTLLDYLDNTEVNVLEGKVRIREYYERLIEDPFTTDMNFFSWNLYDLLKKKQSYNPSKDNITALFSSRHFFFENEQEEKKYKCLLPASIKYSDIDADLDMIKGLLNTVTDENKFFADLPKGTSIIDIYNLTAKVFESDQEEDDSTLQKYIDNINRATTLISNTDSMLWYFTNYITTTAHYKQLEKQLEGIKQLLKDLGIEKTGREAYLIDKLNDINKAYDSSIDKYSKQAAKANAASAKAQARLDQKTTSKEQQAKKEHRAEWTERVSNEKAEILEKTQLEKDTKARVISRWENKYIKRADIKLRDAGVEEANIRLNIEMYEQNSFARIRKVTDSPLWFNLIYRVSAVSLLSSIYSVLDDRNSTAQVVGNSVAATSALTQFVAIVGDKYFSLHQDRWKVWMKRLNFKNEKLSFGLRGGMAASLIQVAADSVFAYQNWAKGNNTAASLHASTATSLALAYYFQWSMAMGASTSYMPYVAGTFVAIGIITGIASSFYESDEFEDFVAGTVFAKGGLFWESKKIDIQKFNTSYKLGIEFCLYPFEYADKSYTGLGYTSVDLTKFITMFDIIRSLFTPIKVVLHGSGDRTKGGDLPLIKYSRFRLWIKYDGGIFTQEKREYEARLYPYGSEVNPKVYNKIELSADKDLTKDEGTLFRFAINDWDMPQVRKGETDGRNADLVVLVRIKSLDRNQKQAFYPSKQNGEDVYLGFRVKLIEVFNNYFTFSKNLQPLSLSQILTMGD